MSVDFLWLNFQPNIFTLTKNSELKKNIQIVHFESQATFRGISGYSATQTSEAVYIIGGWYTENIVAEFQAFEWRRLADLKQGRFNHASIVIGDQTVIIGGFYSLLDWHEGE